MLRRLVVVLIAIAVAVPAGAVVKYAGEDPAAPATAMANRSFVADAGREGMAAIEVARLVGERGSDPRVVDFAREVIRDHETATERLRRIARNQDIPFPEDPAEKLLKPVDDLAGLRGAEFDRAYLQHVIETHETAIAAFQRYAEAGDDAELRLWATETLPVLQRHLQQARALREMLGA